MSSEDAVQLESTLHAVAVQTALQQKVKSCVFGVVVDATPPLRTERYSNYFTVLKVVDPSFNYRCPQPARGLIFHKHVDVYIFSESPVQAPRVRFVGDIIRLQLFKFRVRENGDMRCYDRRKSNWDLFGGQKDDPFEPFAGKHRAQRCGPLSALHVGRLSDLRYWADHFFFSNFLRFVTWWRGPDFAPVSAPPGLQTWDEKNRDLVVHCVRVDVARRCMVFHDHHGLVFRLEVEGRPTLQVGAIVQLRNVNVHWRREEAGWVGCIEAIIYSSCLFLPPFSCDFRALSRQQVKDGAPATARLSLELFQPQPVGDGPALTALRPGVELGPPSSIAQLRQLLLNQPQKHIARKFAVEAEVAGFHTLDPAVIVQRYYPFEKRAIPLSEPVLPGKKHRIMYNLLLYVTDPGGEEQLPVYVVSNENEFYLFDQWLLLPRSDDTSAWSYLTAADVQPFADRLQRLVGRRLTLILQLTLTVRHSYFFKLVDTVFLPFE